MVCKDNIKHYRKTMFFMISALLCSLFLKAQEERQLQLPLFVDTAAVFQLVHKGEESRYKQPDQSMSYFSQALLYSKHVHYNDGIAAAMLGIASLYLDEGKLIESKNELLAAQHYCELSNYNNRVHAVMLNNGLGVVYTHFGMYDTAIQHYYKAITIHLKNKINDSALLLQLYNNIGGSLVTSRNYNQALYYLKKAEAIAINTNSEGSLGGIYVNFGAAYIGKQSTGKAFSYLNQAIVLARKYKYKVLEAFAEYTLGNLLFDQNESMKALTHFQNALNTDSTNIQTRQISYRGLAAANHKLRNFAEAETYYLKTLKIIKDANRTRDIAEIYNNMATMYQQTGNFERAYHYKNEYSHLMDSILDATRISTLNQLEVKFRTIEKDKELLHNQLRLNQQQFALNQKSITISIILFTGIFLLVLAINIYISFRRRQKLQQSEIFSLQKEQELKRLKAVISGEEKERIRIARELHDGVMMQFSLVKMNLSAMFNRSLLHGNNTVIHDIIGQLDSATRELRKSAHNLMPDMLLEEGLYEALHYFCNNLMQSTGLIIELQLYGKLPAIAKDYELLIYRIMQELLQNILKHAQATNVLVQINSREHHLSIIIEDNGVGFIEKELPHNRGMGIKDIRTRVQLLQGKIDISSEKNIGTTVYLEFETSHLK